MEVAVGFTAFLQDQQNKDTEIYKDSSGRSKNKIRFYVRKKKNTENNKNLKR